MIYSNKTNCQVLSRIPVKPYCSDDLRRGLQIRPQEKALRFRYIQFNHLIVNYLIFDIDRPSAALAWEDANLPAPNIAVINPANQHAHLIYRMEKGVSKFPDSSMKALRYLAAVEAAYTARLGADLGYAGLIAKNPINAAWKTWNITDRQYELAELADYVELEKVRTNLKPESEIGNGRNCHIFDSGRYWAYKAVKNYRHEKTYQDFLNAVFLHLSGLNAQFPAPLPINEVLSTAKSIAGWTWKHDKEANKKFIARQTYKSGLGNNIKTKISNQKIAAAIELKQAGYSIYGIARELGISKRQAFYYFNEK